MVRPVKVKTASEQLLVLSRMLKQVEVDPLLDTRQRNRIKKKIGALMTEFQSCAIG